MTTPTYYYKNVILAVTIKYKPLSRSMKLLTPVAKHLVYNIKNDFYFMYKPFISEYHN